MKISYVSDLHYERLPTKPSPLSIPSDADVLVIAGDLNASRQVPNDLRRQRDASGIPIIYVTGNHEFYGGIIHDDIAYLRKELEGEEGIHFLENDQVEISDVRFLGATLWTDFRLQGEGNRLHRMGLAEAWMNDYKYIRVAQEQKLRASQTVRLHEKSRSYLAQMLEDPSASANVTVFVTHHMPHYHCGHHYDIKESLKPAYASDMRSLMSRDDGPDLWISGHGHETHDFEVGSCRLVANPRGYVDKPMPNGWQNIAWNPQAVVDTDLLPRFRPGAPTP